MKILLVNPPIPISWYNDEYYLPSSLLYLASSVRESGNCVKILDMKALKPVNQDKAIEFYEKALLDTIDSFSPDIIGFGCLFSGNFPDVLRFSVLCKEKFENIPIVAGGIHFTIYANEILNNCPSIDWIILGEGEESIVQLINTIKNKQNAFDKIDGFAYRDNGKVKVSNKRNYYRDINDVPFPAYELIDLEDYFVDTTSWHNPKKLPINTSIPLISSRSCPYQCTFCSMYMVMGSDWRARSASNLVDEIEFLYNKYKHRHFSFMDDNFTLSKKRIIEICDLIKKRKLNIQFETPNGLSLRTLDKDVIDALVSAGLVRISLAIESGSDHIRNNIMKKKLKREKIYEIVEIIRKHTDLFVSVFFVIGMPEETQETLEETYNMIKYMNVDKVHLMNIIPFPSTEVFEQAKRDNILIGIDPDNMYKADDLYFKNFDRYFVQPYELSLQELNDFRARCDSLIAQQKADKSNNKMCKTSKVLN